MSATGATSRTAIAKANRGQKESLSIIKARATVDADKVDYYLLFFKWRQE